MAIEETKENSPVSEAKAAPVLKISQKIVKAKLPKKNKTGLPRRQKKALQARNNRVAA